MYIKEKSLLIIKKCIFWILNLVFRLWDNTFYHLFCPSVPPLFVIKSLPSLEIKPTSTSDYKCRWQSHLDCSAIQQFLTMTLFSIFSFLFKQTLQLIKVKNVHPEYCAGFWTHNLHNASLLPKPLDQFALRIMNNYTRICTI